MTEVDDETVVTDHAYLLFYMRKSLAQESYNLDALKTAGDPALLPVTPAATARDEGTRHEARMDDSFTFVAEQVRRMAWEVVVHIRYACGKQHQ